MRKRKTRQLRLIAASGVFAIVGQMARGIRAFFPGAVHLPLVAGSGNFQINTKSATLTKTTVTLSPAWQLPATLNVPQGQAIQLSQYIANKGDFAPKYSVALGTLPANVTLDQNTGVLTAAGNATIGAQATGVEFQASDAGPLTYSVSTVPLVGPGLVFGASKNLTWQKFGTKWYQVGGDHPRIDTNNTPGGQDGRQEIVSLDLATNTFTLEQPYFLRSGDNLGNMQGALPDDPSSVLRGAGDSAEIWIVANERVAQYDTDTETLICRNGAYSGQDHPDPTIVIQDMENVCAWNPTTKRHRAVMTRFQDLKGDRGWCSAWDSVKDLIITPVANSFVVIDAANGTDVSGRAGGNLYDYGNYDFHASGIAIDGRTCYVYDQGYARGRLYSFNLDWFDKNTRRWYTDPSTNQLRLVAQMGYNTGIVDPTYPESGPLYALCYPGYLPGTPLGYGGGRGCHMVWHAGLRTIVVFDVYRRGGYYRVDTGESGYFTRQDGLIGDQGNYLAPSYSFYDDATGDIWGIGTQDFVGSTVSTVYWRSHFAIT